MQELSLEEQAAKLREDLRNERRDSSYEGNRGTFQGSRGSDATFGPNSEDFRADSGEISRNAEIIGSDNRGTQGKPKRSRQNRRRLSNNRSSFTEGSSETYSVGLEREDIAPIGEISEPRTQRIKGMIDGIKQSFRGSTKSKGVLTKKEAEEYREPLKGVIQSYGEYADKAIELKTKVPVEVWGNINDTEAYALTDILIRRGQKNEYAADVVRKMIDGEDYAAVAIMFIPRIMITVEVLRMTGVNTIEPDY